MTAGIVVTGLGAVCGAGVGLDAVRSSGAQHGPRCLDDFDPTKHVPFRGTRALCRASQLACVAAAQAVAAAGTGWSAVESSRRAVVVGTQYGSIGPLATFNRTVVGVGPQGTLPMSFPNVVVNVHAGQLGIFLGAAGPNLTVCGPVAGLEAVLEAVDLIELDRADVVVAGGTESSDAPVALDDPGEGSAMVVIARRNAQPAPTTGSGVWALLETLWGPSRSVGYDALDAADLRPDEVDWWDGSSPPVDAPTPGHRTLVSATGDCRAANGALALVAALDAVRRQSRPAVVVAHRPADGPARWADGSARWVDGQARWADGPAQGVAVVLRPT